MGRSTAGHERSTAMEQKPFQILFDAKPFKETLTVAGSFNLKTIYRPPWLTRNPKKKREKKRGKKRAQENRREAKNDEEELKVLKQVGTCSCMIQDDTCQ